MIPDAGADKAVAQAILDQLDQVANQFIKQSQPIRFVVAQSPAELEMAYRLRYQEVIARGWANPADYPDQMERDAYDEQARQIVGWDGETLAATTRLVFPSAERLLPTEAAFDLNVEPRGQVVDMGRTVVAPAYRGSRQHTVLLGLLARAWLEARSQEFNDICCTFAPSILELYATIGLRFTVLGAARDHLGELRYPCQFDTAGTARSLRRASA